MATFASVAGVKLPEKDREGKPIIFDSYDMSPVLLGTGKVARNSWFYFTENELTPGAARVGNYKACSICAATMAQPTGGLAVDTQPRLEGAEKYVATVPQVFDLWQDPQERYDIFMNNYTERTWMMVTISAGDQGTDEDLRAISATQAAERDLRRAPSRFRNTRSSSGFGSSCRRRASGSRCRPATRGSGIVLRGPPCDAQEPEVTP